MIDYDEIIQDFKSRVLPTRRMSIAAGLLPKITIEEAPDTESENIKEVNEDKDNIMPAEEDEKALRLPKIRRTSKVNESAFRIEMGFFLLNVRLACDHLFGKLLFTWLSLVMSMMVSFVLSFFPRDVLDEILNLIESVSEDFPSYSHDSSIFLMLFL